MVNLITIFKIREPVQRSYTSPSHSHRAYASVRTYARPSHSHHLGSPLLPDSTHSPVAQGLLTDYRKERNQHLALDSQPLGAAEWRPLRSTTQRQCPHLPSSGHLESSLMLWAVPGSPLKQQEQLTLSQAARDTCLSPSWPRSPAAQHHCFCLNRPHVKRKNPSHQQEDICPTEGRGRSQHFEDGTPGERPTFSFLVLGQRPPRGCGSEGKTASVYMMGQSAPDLTHKQTNKQTGQSGKKYSKQLGDLGLFHSPLFISCVV